MATKIQRCNYCGSHLVVSLGAQSVRCPVCQSVTLVPQTYNNAAVTSQHNGWGWNTYATTTSPNANYPTAGVVGYGYYPPQTPPPPPVYGKKRAVLCGVSYRGQQNSLNGNINDVMHIKSFLVRRGFPHASILVLTEDDPLWIPTKYNMQRAMNWLVQGCQSGDSLVFYYTGHGLGVPDFDGDERDGYDEALCPVDYMTAGMILDDEINARIVRPLPHGAKLHAIIETCHSGTVLDLQFLCRMNQNGYYAWEDQCISHTYKGTNGGRALCLSSCDDHQISTYTPGFTGEAASALTISFLNAVESQPTITYGHLLTAMRSNMCKTRQGIGLNRTFASPYSQEVCKGIVETADWENLIQREVGNIVFLGSKITGHKVKIVSLKKCTRWKWKVEENNAVGAACNCWCHSRHKPFNVQGVKESPGYDQIILWVKPTSRYVR
ncbi:hypothetical protein RJ640_009028 [Escallonia rubra]|uniref:Uncharacterized protein n=1 Tax=Escallonia rubra TaxID=112253 RepID=A0AA88RN81_9ASTE|nr:hypothetical protein RJ640_009028 [Escallonia rubra]